MSSENKLGIWMDHSKAQLIEFKKEALQTATITSNFDHDDMEEALNRSENLMHNKRQQQQAAYYGEISNAIKQYKEVLLFGPTDAKTELLNTLNKDLHFENIKIEVKSADNMSENEKLAFVKTHYSK